MVYPPWVPKFIALPTISPTPAVWAIPNLPGHPVCLVTNRFPGAQERRNRFKTTLEAAASKLLELGCTLQRIPKVRLQSSISPI